MSAGRSFRQVIAVVGGGFSGVLTAVHLLRLATRPLRVILIERDDVPGRGVAYRDQPECHLLNVRAEAMSAFADAPDHFLNWLNRCYSPCHPVGTQDYLPRRIYGAYLQSLLSDALLRVRRGVTLEVRQDEVLGLLLQSRGLSLHLRDNNRLRADCAVFALGNPGPADPPLADRSFFASPRYLGRAWSTPGLYAVQRDENLLLIGSGLTTLDWLASLHARGHRGLIHVVSRRGLLPQAHGPAVPHALSFDPFAVDPRVAALLAAIRAEIARVTLTGGDWRPVVDALRSMTPALWQRLPLAEQRRFLRHLRPYWEVHRHRAAPRAVEALASLLHSGQLQLIAGRLQSSRETGQAVEVQLQLRGSYDLAVIEVQRVINCTGPECDYRRLSHPLLVSLREQGLARADALGLGLETDRHGALLDTRARASTQLFTLGPPRKGQLWETTAVPELRAQAEALALYLLNSVEEQRLPDTSSTGANLHDQPPRAPST